MLTDTCSIIQCPCSFHDCYISVLVFKTMKSQASNSRAFILYIQANKTQPTTTLIN